MKQGAIDQWGIAGRYQDGFGQWRPVPPRTRRAVIEAMGKRTDAIESGDRLHVLQAGRRMRLKNPATLVLEDGTALPVEKLLLRDLPVGYHELIDDDGGKTKLIVTPGECYLPRNLRAWGWGVQLYSMRSEKSWGLGDLRDLRKFGRWSAGKRGCGYILVNPLAAPLPVLPQQRSPYYPGSRRFLNPLYLCLEEVPGADDIIDRKILAHAAALNRNRLIDHDTIYRLKLATLGRIWRGFTENRNFEKFCERGGRSLRDYATFCTLAEHFNSGWTSWPQAYSRPCTSRVLQFALDHEDRVRFHQWLQWLAHEQLERVVKTIPLVHDLPVGIDPRGADAWVWQDVLARDISVGAPPDGYNRNGQDWGIQPFIPHRLRATFYEPFRETVRAALRFGGGLRIDHVMGLSRLFWIPKNTPATQGAYVYNPIDELMAILAIESHRAKAWIIGEDLGTVEPAMREELRRQKILSCRVLWFEGAPTSQFPSQSMASVTTHDLTTIAGLWNGSDMAAQEKAGLNPDKADVKAMRQKLANRVRLPESTPVTEVIVATYKNLSRAPSRLLTVTLEDALTVAERPNMPGTTTQWPNWSQALPVKLEGILKNPLVRKVAGICGKR